MTSTSIHPPSGPGTAAHAERRRRNIEAIYPLLPIQRALLLSRTRADDDPGFLQVRCTMEGPLDARRFRAAWDQVVARHPALRMSCQGKRDAEPMLVVWRKVPLPFTHHDRRDTDGHVPTIEEYLAADRSRGLTLESAPVMRVAVFTTDDHRHELIWTCHHLFLDGWSTALVLDEVLGHHTAASAGTTPTAQPADAYRRYRSWVGRGVDAETRHYWTRRLAGYRPPHRIDSIDADGSGFGTVEKVMDRALVSRMTQAADDLGVTAGVLLQGAWALVVSRLTGRDDVVFGTTVSGRTVPVDGIENMVGLLSNMIPVRATVASDKTAAQWLRRVLEDQFEAHGHEHAFLSDIQAWAGGAGGSAQFDTLLVVENFPAPPDPATGELRIGRFRSGLTTTLPLTLAVAPGDTWSLSCTHDRSRVSEGSATQIVEAFLVALSGLVDNTEPDLLRDALPGLQTSTAATSPSPARTRSDRPAAPRDQLDERMIGIWEDTLRLPDIGLADDFFELGGTSIVAVRLFSEIERQLGARLPLATLLEAATVGDLADRIRDGATTTWECLVPIQTSGSQRPLACIHAGELHVLFYRHLAQRLGDDQPVYGLEPAGRSGTRPPLETIAEMAHAYVEDLRSVQPSGPYRLLGYCNGGVVCVEMARQLEAAGQRVELIALLDPFLPNPKPVPTIATRARRILVRGGPAQLLTRVGGKFRREAVQRARRLVGPGGEDDAEEQVRQACARAFDAHRPQPCEAPLTLIWASDYNRQGWEPRWRELGSGVEAHTVDASHRTMLLEPDVENVAALLDRLLTELA